jgi:predicted DNA repair protein MutK
MEISMAGGLMMLFDDMAALAKSALVSLDDVAAQTIKAGGKAAGVVIDDTAVTPRYVVGLKPERELPIVFGIARGSLVNKAILTVAILIIGQFLPWYVLTGLLMIGGVFLSYEGSEKVLQVLMPHAAHAHEAHVLGTETDPVKLEREKIRGAIRTDFILSAEIMALTYSTITDQSLGMQVAVLIAVGFMITFGVYGAVALIVKADDVGLAMARMSSPILRVVGRGLVKGMPRFLNVLATVGTAAMLWVGGQIITHGLAQLGFAAPEHFIHDTSETVGHLVGYGHGLLVWLTATLMQSVVALAVGGVVIAFIEWLVLPILRFVKH